MNISINFKRLTPNAIIPSKATDGSANYDIYLPFSASSNIIDIAKDSVTMLKLGFAVEIPKGYKLVLKSRSGLASKGIIVVGGEIDSDYRGEVAVLLASLNYKSFFFDSSKAIAQMCVEQCYDITFNVVDELTPTDRGQGGFGSTDKEKV